MRAANRVQQKNEDYADGTKEGYELAKYHCGTCHGFIEANVLTKRIWEDRVLPAMAPMLGVEVLWGKKYVNEGGNGAALAFTDWMKIVEYYTKSAPDTIAIENNTRTFTKTGIFETIEVEHPISNPSKTVLTFFDTTGNYIYTSDDGTDYLYKWNNTNNVTDSLKTYSPVVHVSFFNENKIRKGVMTMIGSLRPSDAAIGKIVVFDADKPLNKKKDTIALDVTRPVQTTATDLNEDGLVDFLTCGFGRMKGGVYWYRQDSVGKYSKQILSEIPGATQAHVQDFNGDRHPDIMVMFAHSEESIRLFTNDGKGNFEETTIMNFPAVYGSSSMQILDFNKDGLYDLLYTCGDNNDLSSIFKPFHGVYIYLNEGENKFRQEYFYHINGCTKAVATDFDKDGDLDIAAIAFYGDYKNTPDEKFIFLEQTATLKFEPKTADCQKSGRWLTMDVTDIDNDGDADILLGNFADNFFINKGFKPTWNMKSPFTVLRNVSATSVSQEKP